MCVCVCVGGCLRSEIHYVCMFVRVYPYIYVFTHECEFVGLCVMCLCVSLSVFTCVYVCRCVGVSVWCIMCVCMYVSMCVLVNR